MNSSSMQPQRGGHPPPNPAIDSSSPLPTFGPPDVIRSEFDRDHWITWLQANTDTSWRPGEWDHDVWLFRGDPDNPLTAVSRCHGCDSPTASTVLCHTCTNAHRKAGGTLEEFLSSYSVPRRKRRGGRRNPGKCQVRQPGHDGLRCPRMPLALGLCDEHQIEWYHYRRRRGTSAAHRQAWATSIAQPFEAADRCLAPGCELDASFSTRICTLHRRRYGRSGKRVPVEQWATTQGPAIEAHLASLAPLSEQLRWELLHAMTVRDERAQAGEHGGRMEPGSIRSIVKWLASEKRAQTASEDSVAPPTLVAPIGSELHEKLVAKFKDNRNVAAHVSEFARILTAAHDRCFGISPTKTLVWNLPALNDHGRLGAMQVRAGRQVTIDFAAISVGWLRDLTQLWIAAEIGNIPPSRIPDTIRAVTAASEALSHRPGGGQDPTEVTVADLDAIIDAIRHLTNLNAPGRPLASKTRAGLVVRLFDLLEYGHAHGHLIALAPSFYRRPHHRIQVLSHENEERSRQGLPDHVIDLLDGHLDLIAASNPYPGLTHEQRQQMGRCLYILLRDTGRRPYEVCTLRRDCLIDGPEPELLWNNSKSNRPSRRLPITGDTAAEIRAWQGVRSSVLTAPTSDDFLFPGRHPRPASHEPHLSTKTLRKWIADWAAHVNDVAQDHLGRAHPLENIRVFPYSFRHSYAQRHVDAGVESTSSANSWITRASRSLSAITTSALRVNEQPSAPLPTTSSIAMANMSPQTPAPTGCAPSRCPMAAVPSPPTSSRAAAHAPSATAVRAAASSAPTPATSRHSKCMSWL